MPTIGVLENRERIARNLVDDGRFEVLALDPGAIGQTRVDAIVIDVEDNERARELVLRVGKNESMIPTVVVIDELDPELVSAIIETDFLWLDEKYVDTRDHHGVLLLSLMLERFMRFRQIQGEFQSLKHAKDQLVQAEKLAAVGLLAAEIAHEINNPSTFVITNLSVMLEYVSTIGRFHERLRRTLDQEGKLSREQFHETAKKEEIEFLQEDMDVLVRRSLAGLERIHQIVEDLRYFSHEKTTEPGWLDLGRLIQASINLIKHEARYRATIELDLEQTALYSDPNRLGQVILNLLVNAVHAIEPGHPETNRIWITSRSVGNFVHVTIADTGPGIAHELLDKIFEPFFTTKEPGMGTGLGLSISRDIMRSLGGDILVESTPGKGARFTLTLPAGEPRDERSLPER